MRSIRELFHRIGNLHNKISVGAGVAKAELKQKFKGRAFSREIQKLLTRLTALEKNAVEASKTLNRLKDAIYGLVEPDRDNFRKGGKLDV